MKQKLSQLTVNVGAILIIALLVLSTTGAANASFTSMSATLNGSAPPITVGPNASITVALTVTVNSTGGNNNWKATRWQLDGGATTCINHADHAATVTFTETFAIAGPATIGNHDLALRAYNTDDCSGSGAVTLNLNNGIVVPNPAGNLDQCANGGVGDPPILCNGAAWQNGNLNGNQAHYRESDSVPYRMRLSNIATSGTHTLVIEWDTTQTGKHAIDYLTSFDRTETTALPCSGVAGCGSPATFPIPVDPNVTKGQNGVDDAPAGPTGGDDITQAPGNFTCFNCTITSASAYTLTGTYAGNSQTRITISFTSTSATPVIAWGGHIGSQINWGIGNSASAIAGSPYHMRLISLDGAGGNQDRSLASGAVPPIPGLTTQVSTSTINVGQPVTDTATFTQVGTNGPVTGTVKFFVCGPFVSATACATGGTQVGGAVAIASNSAASAAFTPAAPGAYCFRAEYTPDTLAKYSPINHTNTTTECFTALALPNLTITKQAAASPVNAGDNIGFTITVNNTGGGIANNVTLSDPLPTGAGLSWSIANTTGAPTCSITAGVLNCSIASLASGAGFSVQITSPTTAESCGTYLNTATVQATNNAAVQSAASITVNCPDVEIVKTADNGTINAGDAAGFTLTVTNSGAGTAYGVTVSDTLPASVNWTITPPVAGCSIVSGVLNCNLGNMAPGANVAIHISGQTDAADCGLLENTATVTASNEPTAVQNDNSSTATIAVNCPEIDLTKTPDAANVNAGDTIGFTLSVNNVGPGTAYNVTLADTLPTTAGLNWSISPANPDCSILAGILTCNFGALAPNTSASVHLASPTTPASCSTISNTAEAAASNGNTDQATGQTVVDCPNVMVSKTADNSPINAGDTASFTITAANNGLGAAYGVTLTDNLPAGVNWAINGGTGAGLCNIAGGALSCNFGSLSPGASLTVTVSGQTAAADCGELENTVTIAATNEAGPAQNDNTSTANIAVNCPDVEIVKTADNGTISAGDAASFTVTVTNSGNGAAYGVTLSDSLPAGVTWAETADSDNACQVNGAPGSQTLDCGPLTLPAGESFSVAISGETDAADCGLLENTASVVATNEASADQSDNASTANIAVNCADIDIAKVADNGSVNAGDSIGYIIAVANNGLGIARNVTLTDTLPANAGLSWTIDGGTGAAQCAIVGGVLTCNFGDLASNASFTVHISSPTTPATCGTVENIALVTTTNDGSAQASSQIVVNCPNVAVSKTADNSPINAGDTASFTLTVTNNGAGAAYGVTLTDNLPTNVNWTITGGTGAGLCNITGGVLSCNFGNLASGASLTVLVSGATDANDCGELQNTAAVAAANEAAADQDNNSSTASITVNCPDVTVIKTADAPTIDASDTAAFTIVVSNIGPGAAYNVTLNDALPTGINWVIDPAVAGCSITGGVLSCNFAGLASGDSITIHVSGETDAADCGLLENTVTIAATNEAGVNQGNNSSTAAITINCADIELAKTADDDSVNAGDPIGFTLTVSNVGAGTAKGVTLTDALPSNAGLNWTIDPPVAGCSIVGGLLTCNFGNVPASGNASVHITSPTTPDTCGNVNNLANVTTTNDGLAEASAGITVNCPNVTVSKTADNSLINAGDTASFTLTVTNNGAGTAYGVTLNDTLPVGVNWSVDNTTDCAIVNGVLSCNFGNLASGDNITIHVSGETDAADCGTLTNTATVAATNEAGADQGNNSSTAAITVNCPDVTVSKQADDALINPGETAAFTIVVSNNGPGAAYNVTVGDTLPGNVAWSEDNANCAIASGVLSCNFASLASGNSITIHISGVTDTGDCGTLNNSVTVAAGNEPATVQNNNSAQATITVDCAYLIVIKDVVNDHGGSAQAGDFTMTINGTTVYGGAAFPGAEAPGVIKVVASGAYNVTENGPSGYDADFSADCDSTVGIGQTKTCTITNDDQPAHLIVIKHVINNNSGTSVAGDFTMTINGVTVPGGASLPGAEAPGVDSIVHPGNYNVTETGPAEYNAGFSSDCSGDIALGETKTCTVTNDDAIHPAIDIVKSVNDALINSGETVTYTYLVTNTGDDPLINVVVVDDKCASVAYVSGDDGDNVLEPGETWTYTCSTALTADTTNIATATGTHTEGGTVSDTDTEFVDVLPTVDIVKSASPATLPEPGGDFTFTLTVTNTSTEPVVIADLTDTQSGATDFTACAALVGATLASGESASCQYTVNHTDPDEYDNIAGVTVQDDEQNPASDTDDETVTVTDVPSSISVTKTPDSDTIDEPGADVVYTIIVENTSPVDNVTITSVVDDQFGDISAGCLPALSFTLAPTESLTCTVSELIEGNAGDTHINVATAYGVDDDDATLIFEDVLPTGTLDKSVDVAELPEPGGDFTFTLTITNTSGEPVT
ncbi:MAG: DUF11 domain-containing protein, partial [Chloroflexi bacterium]|nr:DUF11 domain-containing protein [Chloroflexota bacterium]